MRNRLVIAVLAVALLAATGAARADETTYCNAFIASVPYTITVQGHYCFDRNLSVNIMSGAAITIAADFVLLDLNNFKLGGGSAGTATDAIGISAFERSNVTIRGGNIRGFAHGIVVDGSILKPARNVTIEHNVVDGNLKTGINAYGDGVVIRHNVVTNTGGSTSTNFYCEFDGGRTEGISLRNRDCIFVGGLAEIHANTVMRTGPGTASGPVFGIFATGGIVRANTVFFVSNNNGGKGINAAVCRDNTVFGVSTGTADGYQCTYLDGINAIH